MTIHTGDCIEVMAAMEPDSVDAVVTDPPYGLEFMGKAWDSANPLWRTDRSPDKTGRGSWFGDNHDSPRFKAGHPFQAWCEAWGREALRVTKPGGYLLAFGGTRTHHRLVCGLEDAGWIIRDELTWVYASGFPKGKANLKPAHEPIVLARKPGPLRPLAIDACRIQVTDGADLARLNKEGDNGWKNSSGGPNSAARLLLDAQSAASSSDGGMETGPIQEDGNPTPSTLNALTGRWPSNLLLSDPELFDQPNPYVVGSGAVTASGDKAYSRQGSGRHWEGGAFGDDPTPYPGDVGGYSRFFRIPDYAQAEPPEGDPAPSPSTHGGRGEYPSAFIVPKADRSDREPVLRDAAVLLHRARGECDKLPAWDSEDQSPSEQTDSTSPARATSASKPAAASSSATSLPTKPLTDQSQPATSSTTSTATSKTIGSPTSFWSTPPPISESTPVANSAMENGGSPADPVDSSSLWGESTGISAAKDGPSTVAAAPAISGSSSRRNRCALCGKQLPRVGVHPTTKPTDLMRHLIRLVTPSGGLILDPFLGSGSTAIAAELEGFAWVGIEKEPEYVAIAEARLNGTQRGLGLDVGAPIKPQPKTHPDLAKHQPKQRAPHTAESIFTGFVGTPPDEEPAA